MSTKMINHIAISGAKGFVGKNLRNFLSKNKIRTISISRNHFKKNQFPSLNNTSHFVHLAGIGSESIDQKFGGDYNQETHNKEKPISQKTTHFLLYGGLGVVALWIILNEILHF